MSEQKQVNLYEVLGIARDADERAIKKAYFTLVRKYPPETHPEEFKRIREAYEVLSNPQSRADYDSVDKYSQFGEEVQARMQSGLNAMEASDWKTAQGHFVAVLALQPNLHFARDLLGMAYLNNNQPAEALAQFEALIAAQPENAVYQLHKGYAHYHQKQYVPAMAAFREANRLDPIDTRALVAMADTLAGQKQWEAALAELDKAIHLDGQVDFQDFVFFMRKIQIQLLRNRADLAEQDLDQMFKILPDDAETKKYVATRLASLAADLFAMKRSVDGNRLLARCRALDPSRASMAFQFPSRVRLKIAELSQSSREWIAGHGKEWAAGKLSHNAWTAPILLLVVAALFTLGVLVNGFGARHLWDAGQRVNWVLMLLGAPLLLALGIRRVARVARSPYGKYTTIHPLHLMQVDVDKVTLWPLVNLHDVSLTHHSTNGVYQYTAVRLDFAGTLCNLTIRGQQASVDWANRVLGQRQRVLGLMSEGLLDAEEGYDLVPPSQLGPPKKDEVATEAEKAQKKKALTFYGVAAGVGAVLAAIAIPYNRGAAERSAWHSASLYPSISEYRRYLDLFPSGPHAAEARAGIDTKYDEAIALYKSRAQNADPKGQQAIVDVIEALKKSNSKRVKITYQGSFDWSEIKSIDKAKFGDVIAPDDAFSASYNRTRQSSITASLRRAFGEVLSHDVIDFDDGGYAYGYDYDARGRRREEPSPVTFVVQYRVGPSGSIYESTTGTHKKLFGILFDWSFAIRFENEQADRYHIATTSRPEKNIRYTVGEYESNSDIVPYTKMAESAFDDFGRKLAGTFGVTVPAPTESEDVLSKYGRNKYGSPNGLSPEEMQKLLEALKKAKPSKPAVSDSL
jgi:curved DNA-binding protein CbpA